MADVEELAQQIAALPPEEQERLLDRVAALTLQRGLRSLSEKYRERLRRESRLDESVEAIWEALQRVRQEVATCDYPD